MTNSVTKTTLSNGLTVVLKEMHHAPVISFMMWYRVGSRYEKPGQTGISHWVEHMMFKGSPTFPAGTLDRLVSREGGIWNAFTWLDFTAYYETMPADRIDLALRLEADRMLHTNMASEEVESERQVIIAERQMYENEPDFQLNEALTAVAFETHPYHHDVIGDMVDLHTITRDDLLAHYQTYYKPNNVVAVVVGDFNTAQMLQRIDELFGAIPGDAQPIVPTVRPEPSQNGERRVTVRGPGDTAYLTYAYRAPAADHPDFFPFALFNAAFAGGSSLSMFGGGGSNKSSRLYKALVQADIAVSASGSLAPTVDPYLYTISAVARHGRTLAEVEAALEAELARLKAEPITQQELDRALKRAKVDFVLSGESITGQAQLLGVAEAVVGDYRWYETALDQLNAVTLADVERIRYTYLQKQHRVVGYYEPEEEALEEVEEAA